MDELIEFVEKPVAQEMYMIAGWRQWADAGVDFVGLAAVSRRKNGGEKNRAGQVGRVLHVPSPWHAPVLASRNQAGGRVSQRVEV